MLLASYFWNGWNFVVYSFKWCVFVLRVGMYRADCNGPIWAQTEGETCNILLNRTTRSNRLCWGNVTVHWQSVQTGTYSTDVKFAERTWTCHGTQQTFVKYLKVETCHEKRSATDLITDNSTVGFLLWIHMLSLNCFYQCFHSSTRRSRWIHSTVKSDPEISTSALQ